MYIELVRAAINGSTDQAATQALQELRNMYADSSPARCTKTGYWALVNYNYWRLVGCEQFATEDEACLAHYIIKSGKPGAKVKHKQAETLSPSSVTLAEALTLAQRKANGKHQCRTEELVIKHQMEIALAKRKLDEVSGKRRKKRKCL